MYSIKIKGIKMKNKIVLSGVVTVALLSLVGCGGGSGTDASAKTGTGYYVDNAVAGVDYACGTQKGKTDKEGKFTFEEGKACSFTLAGIPLRTTPASELADGKKILEDNPKVAKFLQSIDADGDLSNGIQITDEVLTVLTNALDASQSSGTLPEGAVLTEVVASVGHDIDGVSGDVRSDDEVEEHLTQTQTEIIKELLAGKTFYFRNDLGTISEAIVNKDATTIKLGPDPVTSITINGNKITDKDGDHYIDKVTEKYIEGHDSHGEFKFYFTRADAEAALSDDSGAGTPSTPASQGNSDASSDTLSSLIVGKTYYTTTEDSYTDANGVTVNNNHVETLSFNVDGHTLTDTWVENGETITRTFNYNIENNSLNISGVNGEGNAFNFSFANFEKLSDHLRFTDSNGKESGRFFFTYDAAEAAL